MFPFCSSTGTGPQVTATVVLEVANSRTLVGDSPKKKDRRKKLKNGPKKINFPFFQKKRKRKKETYGKKHIYQTDFATNNSRSTIYMPPATLPNRMTGVTKPSGDLDC